MLSTRCLRSWQYFWSGEDVETCFWFPRPDSERDVWEAARVRENVAEDWFDFEVLHLGTA